MRKKFIMLLLTVISTLCLAVGLSACGSSSGSSGGLSGGTEQSGSGGGTQQSETGTQGSTGTQESEDQSQSTPGEWDGNEHNLTYVAAVEATCTTDGNIAYWYCTDCGTCFSDSAATNEIDAADTVIPATGHTASEAVIEDYVAPTCSAYGSYVEVVHCAECATVISRETYYIPATGHSWDDGEITTAPTCTETGVTTYTCTTCGETKTEAIAATGHTHGEAVIENEIEATCTQDGSYDSVIYCTVCNGVVSRDTIAIPATGHTSGETTTENYVAATCTKDGSYDNVIYCTVCNGEVSRDTIAIPATGHSYVATVTEPTCTEQGYTTYTCSDCGDTYITNYVEAKGHSWNDGEITTAPTCTETGVTTYTCETCGETKTEAIAATGHNYINDACSICGYEKGTSIGLEYTLSDDETYYTLSGIGTCTDTEIVIPSTYNFLPVVSIDDRALYNYKSITSITIPESITSIGGEAFYGCTSLKSVSIGNGVKTIGGEAFYGCTSLTSIIIPDGVTSIGRSAFSGCASLTSITIPFAGGSSSKNTHFGYIFGASSYNTNSNNIPASLTTVNLTHTSNIDSYAFYNCTMLKSITIPESVTSIGTRAFYYCTALTEINFNATAMEDLSSNNYVFYCAGQSGNGITLNIGANVTKIPAYLFDSSSNSYANITSVVFEESSVCGSIGYYAFCGCTSLTNVYYNGTASGWASISFSGYYANPLYYAKNLYLNGTLATDITLEDITTINAYAFYGCTSLTSIIIGNGITSIDEWAFYNCTSLASITIGSSVTSIGNRAFYNTAYYNSSDNWENYVLYIDDCLILADSVSGEFSVKEGTSVIADSAFSSCTMLTSVYIPDSVTSISANAFYKCTSLESFVISSDNTSFKNVDGNLYSYDGTELIQYAIGKTDTAFTVPDGVTYIDSYAFYKCTSLTSITIPNSVTSIGESAFSGCSSLTSITMPNSVTSIGESAFSGCSSLTGVYYSGTASQWASISFNNYSANPLYYAEILYLNGTVATDITLEGITTISDYAFYKCTSLTSVTILESVTSIGESAFSGCSSLTSITIPDSVTSIGASAFSNCTSLTSVYYSGTASLWASISFESGTANPLYYAGNLYLNGTLATDITLEGITTINDYAFYGCNSLESVTIGDSIIIIGSHAFIGCTSLTSITIPDSITSIGDYAFYGCTSIESITIGSGVITIGNYAFYGCTALTELYFNATAMEDLSSSNYVFTNAGKNSDTLTVTIGANVTKIPAYLFYYHPYVTEIIFEANSNCESIGSCAFYYCTLLTSITIPNSVTSIGDQAFQYCYKLVEIYNLSALNITIGDFNNGCIAYYAKNIYTDTSDESNLIYYKDYIFLNDDGTYYLLGYIGTDTELTLPTLIINNEVVNYAIYNYAFYNNAVITSVTIPDTVTSIGNNAFFNCSALTSVTIGNGVETICTSAFYYCRSLTSVTIGSGVTSIDNYAFYCCTSLKSITIPNSVTSIDTYAFYNCTALTSVTFENTSGWYVTTTEGATSGTDIDVTVTSTNATYLTSTYYKYYWYRGESES